MKFHNPWTIRTPPGWSCLFTAPLNHTNDVVQILAGVVDTDRYQAPVNFPFVTIAGDGTHVLEKGTPLVQVIPFQRSRAQGLRARRDARGGRRARASPPLDAGRRRPLPPLKNTVTSGDV